MNLTLSQNEKGKLYQYIYRVAGWKWDKDEICFHQLM